MKKFILTVAIVCAAVAQAASISWTSNLKSFCDATGTATTTMTGGQLVLVTLGSSIDWSNATVIPKGTGNNTTTLDVNASKVGRVSGKVEFEYTSGGDNFIENGDYLSLMWQDSEGNLSQLLYIDGSTAEAVYKVDSLSKNSSGVVGAAIAFTGNFKAPASDVPEPTSGLLLVVGGALLALRRKQK